jgi:8-oxo-dGTP pyrophosphatase MutT (NUDIX family)
MWSREELIELLSAKLKGELPGDRAHFDMTSRARVTTNDYLQRGLNHKLSAVTIGLFYDKQWKLTLMKRPDYDGVHSGQIALPGGKMEPDDATLLFTAIREWQEETGTEIHEAHILGELSKVYISVSNYLVHPFVAVLEDVPIWNPDSREVQRILTPKLEELFSPEAKTTRKIPVGPNMWVNAPCYLVEEEVLWGATAMIVRELEMLMKP